jgi:2,5-diketo-D-gluconate reductase B
VRRSAWIRPVRPSRRIRRDTAQAYGNERKSAAQVALRWLIQQDGVAAIPRSSKRQHIAANFALFDFALSGEEMAAIDRLRGDTRVVSPSFAPRWDPPG